MVISVMVLLLFIGAVVFADYELTSADPICAPFAVVLLAYIFHLALWNPKEG